MTNESSFDASRHENEVSPRRAARAARQRAEAGGSDRVPPYESADSAYSAASPAEATADEPAPAAAPVAPTEAQIAAEHQRVQAVASAQRARTESAQRARSEAIEAQRAAAERVRETLRANAAGPRRARNASGRSAVTPDSPFTFAPSAAPPSASTAAIVNETPDTTEDAPVSFDQGNHVAAQAPAPAQPVQPVSPEPPMPQEPPAARANPAAAAREAKPGQPWDAREHAAMSFNDILNHPGASGAGTRGPAQAKTPPAPRQAPATGPVEAPQESNPATGDRFTGFQANGGEVPEETAADAPEYDAGIDAAPESSHQSWSDPATPAPVAYGEAYAAPHAHEPADDHHAADGHYEEPLEHGYPEHAYPEQEYTEHGHLAGGSGRENLFLSGPSSAELAQRKRRRSRRNAVMAAILLVFCAVVFGVVMILQGVMAKLNPKDYPAPGGASISFEVKSGWGPQQIGRELVADDIVASDKLFLEAIQLVETENREIHPGKYELRLQMPALDAATILIGEGGEKVSYVAIKQNTRMPAVLEEISKATGLPLGSLEKLADDPAAFGIKGDVKNLEGFLHPGEYRFPVDSDARTVLQLMVDATKKSLTEAGITDPAEQYRTLTIASILQAEARPDDYATVAGAMENRLHANNTETNGLLQVDSTVIYGLDRYTLHFTKEEKADAANPFNSYVHPGLPPTPIGSPGASAIKAAANPKPNDYYYWVTVNTNTGETKFAKTYREHQVNQNEFRAWCAENTDVCK